MLDGPTVGETEQAELKKLLDEVETWAKSETFVAAYQHALVDRLQSQCPSSQDIKDLTSNHPMYARLVELTTPPLTGKDITGQLDPIELKKFDHAITRIILLWREHESPWKADLAKLDAANATLDGLFHEVDTEVWKTLKAAPTNQLILKSESATQKKPRTHEVVEFDLVSDVPNVDALRIRRHPLLIKWTIQPPTGNSRTMEMDALKLVQYFPSAGEVKISAALRWQNETIPVEPLPRLDVVQNPEYGKKSRFYKEWPEYAAISIAALFAIVTAMGTQYDSTFGTLTQYLTIFIWAAGAGTGGNLFSQLGTSSAPAGAAYAGAK